MMWQNLQPSVSTFSTQQVNKGTRKTSAIFYDFVKFQEQKPSVSQQFLYAFLQRYQILGANVND